MSWLLSIVVGLLTAVAAGLEAGFVADLCVGWYRISSFEGASGYFVVFMGLLGAVVGLVIGIVCSLWFRPNFFRGLRSALGSTAVLALLVGGLCRVGADLPPEIDGHELELAIEVRGPEGVPVPQAIEGYRPSAEVIVFRSRSQPVGALRLDEAKQVDRRWVVPATVPLQTSSAQKFLRVYFNQDYNELFPLPLRSHPRREDFEWSPWIEAGWPVDQPKPAPEASFWMRYRIRLVEPPPPGPSPEQVAARAAAEDEAKFQAVAADAPVVSWLPYTRYGTPEARLKIAIARITARDDFVAQLSSLMLSEDPEVRADALRVLEHLDRPPASLAAPVAEVGRQIAGAIRAVNGRTTEQDPGYESAAAVAIQFSAWMVAARALQGTDKVDLTPELGAILELARVRQDSYVMRQDVVRVASYYLQQWAGVAPLPTDPKPGGEG
jgi:hypothetical protein